MSGKDATFCEVLYEQNVEVLSSCRAAQEKECSYRYTDRVMSPIHRGRHLQVYEALR